MCLDAEPVMDVGEPRAELDPIRIVEKHSSAVCSAVHDVAPAAVDVDAQWSCHVDHFDEGVSQSGAVPEAAKRLQQERLQQGSDPCCNRYRKGSRDLDRPDTDAIFLQARMTPGMKLSRS